MYKDMGPPQRKIRAWNQIQNLYYRVTVPTTAPLFYFKGPILLVSSTCNPARFSVQPGKHLLSPGITVSFVKPSTTVHARKFVVKVFNTLISPEVAKVMAQMNFFSCSCHLQKVKYCRRVWNSLYLHLLSVPSKSIIIWSILSWSSTDTSWGEKQNKLRVAFPIKTIEKHRKAKNGLTWPTSAGARVELMCSTAFETPVIEIHFSTLGVKFCHHWRKHESRTRASHTVLLGKLVFWSCKVLISKINK